MNILDLSGLSIFYNKLKEKFATKDEVIANQSDWDETTETSTAYIKNKPTSLPASDVYDWAKAETKPIYTAEEIGLGNVENKSSETIREELTKENVTIALGYTPPTTNTTYGVATQSANGLESAADKKKLDGIATGAEVNQNAFSNVVVGSTTVAADSKTDTLTLVAGSNVTLTPDATNDKITISSTASGGSYVGSSAPSNTSLLWIDTGNGGIVKYYNGSAWTATASIWG